MNNLSPGRWALQPLLIGMLAVGAVVGIIVGRQVERARRGLKDYASAREAVPKGRKTARVEVSKAIRVVALGVGGALVLFLILVTADNHPKTTTPSPVVTSRR
jgi:hypothetical protein